jgi:hypothetical protein
MHHNLSSYGRTAKEKPISRKYFIFYPSSRVINYHPKKSISVTADICLNKPATKEVPY